MENRYYGTQLENGFCSGDGPLRNREVMSHKSRQGVALLARARPPGARTFLSPGILRSCYRYVTQIWLTETHFLSWWALNFLERPF